MRKSLTSMLNDLGNYLRKVDDRYAEGVRTLVAPKPGNTEAFLGTPRAVAAEFMGVPLTHGLMDVSHDPRFINQLAKYGGPAISATTRYVLPAAALTTAGHALSDLVNTIYAKDDER